VRMPEDQLCEVLVILLRNAVEAMPAGGAGVIALRTRGTELVISVRDEGPGISREEIARIFEPGYTTKPEGSGYGLFLARRIVGGVGGRLSARSDGVRGTVMEVFLPRAADAPDARAPVR